MRQRSTMFRGNRMSFHPVSTLGQVRPTGDVGPVQDATSIFVKTVTPSGEPLAGITIRAFDEYGADLIHPDSPRVTGPGGHLQLLLDSDHVSRITKITVQPDPRMDWTPTVKIFDVSDFANSEVTFTHGAAAPGAQGAKSGYSPFVLIGGLAVAAAVIYFATLD